MVKVKKKAISTEEKRKKERDRKRKYREKLKDDQEKLDKLKECDRNRKRKDKEEGKIKTISDMSNREKRMQRKKWREATFKHRKRIETLKNAEQFVEANTPPGSPELAIFPPQGSGESRKLAGQRRSRKRRDQNAKEIKKLKELLEKAKKKTDKWRKKYQRQKKKMSVSNDKNSPGKIADRIISSGPKEVRKNLVTGVALRLQLKENSANCRTQEEKKTIARNIFGPIVSRKKDAKETLVKEKILSPYYQRQANRIIKRRKKRATHISHIKHLVIGFFEDNENSCQAPGKKDYITRQKVQKQKRYLLFPIKELYKKFVQKSGMVKISYQSFIKIKPFWIVQKKVDQRDTCLCKVHSNFKFKLDKLKLLKIIKTSSISQVLKEAVCKTDTMSCMYNECNECNLKISDSLLENESFEDFNTYYYRWIEKKEEYKSKRSDKIIKVKKTVKEKVLCTAKELLEECNTDIKAMAVHVFNMLHQHREFIVVKQELKTNEAIIICDWSENYNCKFSEEVQAIHFGGSRKQIALHTGIVYTKDNGGVVQKLPFCTVSDATDHEAPAVWAHLEPVLELLKDTYSRVSIVHFFTDGPTTQYRNKTNFMLMCKMCTKHKFDQCTWNFWEAGHGKGAADGIGGLVKRTCDRAVAMGKDVTDSAVLLETIKHLNIVTFFIYERKIREMEAVVKDVELEHTILPIPGTMKLKSVIWKKLNPTFFLNLRRLSCSECRFLETCKHYIFKPMTSAWTLVKPKDQIKNKKRKGKKNVLDMDMSADSEDDDLNSLPPTSNEKILDVDDVFSSSSEEEDDTHLEKEEEDQNFKERSTNVEKTDFILVKIEGKKCVAHYVAQVLEKQNDGMDIFVSFLRVASGAKFVFPTIKEEVSIVPEDIVKKLSVLHVSRGRHTFKDNLAMFKNLN